MSDSLATRDALVTPSDNGQAQQASEQAQGSTGGSASQGQPTQDENIRKLQSTYDKKLAEQDKAYKAQMQQQNQMIQQMQQQMREAQKNAAPDDYSKLEVELQWLRQERDQFATAYQREVAEKQEQQARVAALREVADEFDVSVKDLEDATDYKSAVKLAIKAQQDKNKRKQAETNDKIERNTPDLGQGAPRTAQGEWERKYEEARQRKDSAEQARLLRTRGK